MRRSFQFSSTIAVKLDVVELKFVKIFKAAMKRRNASLFILLILFSLTISCTKKASTGGFSRIALIVPSGSSSKSGAIGSKSDLAVFAALPANRKACFGVNVLANDIVGLPATSCSPKSGIIAGFVESGGMIAIDVPKGDERKFELYMYLADENDSKPCPPMGSRFSASDLAHIYYMGSSASVSIRNPVENISISATFPGLSQTLATVNSYSASCLAANTPGTSRSDFSVSTAVQVSAGGGAKIIGRVGANGTTTMIGGGVRLIKK